MEAESKEYSWKWVTYDQRLSIRPCELVSVYLVPSGATTDSHIYDGENATGKLIVTLVASAADPKDFTPGKPVYCRRGLFVDFGTAVTGIFVQWREL